MVKADSRKDYYADLGLAPNAESEDIKKQFRKLALKYHPDRNPGKELDFVTKFQSIQAAHEILSDPQQRLKYDTERLRAGYGKYYAAPKANTSRKTPTSHNSTSSSKPPPFYTRPQSFHNGPSSGAQRYASYARAAPQQSWGKKQDDGQTRADAYRGFQGMKNNPNTSGWSNFDPRTGRSAGASRPNAAPTGSRTQSAYEYFKTSPRRTEPAGSFRNSKKKQGFAPGTAGGDEPMAANTSSYSSVPRDDRSRPSSYVFGNSAPSPTARRAEDGSVRTPDLERARSQYAGTGGEKTFFSSAWLGRSSSMRDSPGSPKTRTSRTNPPSPTAPETSSSRHRSASPHLKTNRNRTFSSSPSSSDTSQDDNESSGESPPPKPKAVPKSKLRNHKRHHSPHDWNPGTGEHFFPTQPIIYGPGPAYYPPWGSRFDYWRPGAYYEYVYLCANREYLKGHDSDSAASPRNPYAGTFASSTFQPQFHPNQTSKSSSHGNLRNEFSAEDWHDTSQGGWSGFFAPKPSETDSPRATKGVNNRGRSAARNGSTWSGPSIDPSSQDSSRSASTSQQQPTAFAGAAFSADDWVEQFKNLSWAAPKNEGTQKQANGLRARSPKKQTKPTAFKARPTPQPASVATEAEEETATTPEDTNDHSSPGGEAMDLDDDTPAKQTAAPPPPPLNPEGTAEARPSKPRPSSSDGGKAKNADSKGRFNLKNLGNTAPFTSTNNGGIDDLQDISATLPFESRAKVPRTTAHDVRPRELACPNPPKRPRRPALAPMGPGAQLALPRTAWERYVTDMNTYMREWNEFNRRMLRHFNARQEANESGLAPNWISSVGDSTRLNINGQDDTEDASERNKTSTDDDDDDENDDIMVAGSARGGYSAYLRAIEEDVKVRKHWDVACELHRESILELGQLREWILIGGKVM